MATLLLLSVGGGVFWFAYTAQGVNRTWDCGGGDSSWDNDLNWSGDTEPGASDVAIFDTTCTNNVTIDKNVSVAGISINSGYTGIITQSSTFTVTVGSSHYSQAAGTFTGGSGSITINGTYTLSGGTFTSTSGTLTMNNGNTAGTFFSVSSGTFNHNNGMVTFASGSAANVTQTIDVNTSLTLYNVTINGSDTGDVFNVNTGDTLIAANDFTHTNSAITGAWEVQGNVTIASTADGGAGTLTMTGTGAKTYTYSSGGIGSHLQVNNASVTVSPNGGTTDLSIYALSVLAGSFTAPSSTLTLNAGNTAIAILTVSTGATFSHNSGTVVFSSGAFSNFTQTIDVDTSLTLHNVTINGGDTADIFSLSGGDTIIVANDFTYTNSTIAGTWEVQGNYTVATTADGGTAGITFTGGNNQTYTDQGGNEPDGDVTINKTIGSSVRLASNADWNAASQDLTITSGELNMGASYNISTTALTVSTNGHLSNYGTGDLTLAGNVSNSGNIRFMSSGSCGGSDSISIASSSAGVQRTWSGSGTYLFHDVTVQDQGGSAAITAYSSTSVSGNGVNWTFSGAACPATAPAAQINSGIINFGTGSYRLP